MTTTYTPGQASKTRMIWAIVIVALVLVVLWNGFAVIPAGNVGVVLRFGAVNGEVGEGLHMLLPFVDHVEIISIQVQKFEDEFETFSKQQQNVYIKIAVNFTVDKTNIQNAYRQFGNLEKMTDKVVAPSVNQVIKSIIPNYPTDQIHLNRDKIRNEIKKRLNESLKEMAIEDAGGKEGKLFIPINYTDVNLVNIGFSKEYTDAIERKQVAEQEVLRAEYKRQEASKNKEIAQINAEGKKIEQQLVNQSLTPAILQNRWIEKWNGILPQVMSGTGSGVILNMTDFNKKP
jgi:regulator of protease activity HflC (stomatin/prohibitin superfamily)